MFRVKHRSGSGVQQILTMLGNMLADAEVTFMYILAADWPQIVESTYTLEYSILDPMPADLVVVTHDTFCLKS
jgi:hypothetical protein